MEPDLSSAIRTVQLGSSWFPERPGGLERYYYDLFNRLPALGFHSRGLVIGSKAITRDTNDNIVAFSEARSSLPQRWYRARSALKKIINEFRPDIICVHFALYGFPATDLLSHQPLVVHFQGPWAGEAAMEQGKNRSLIKYFIENSVYRRATRLIVLSNAFKEILTNEYGVSPEKIAVIPGAIDTRRFDQPIARTEARNILGWPRYRPIILVVRRLSRRMGIENLLTALVTVKARFPDVLLMVAGVGGMAHELARMTESLGLTNHVKFLGFLADQDLPAAYRAADFTVVPTTALEGFGLITVESMASGTPVLVTPVGGLPEIVRPFAPQWVTDDSTASAMARSMSEILSGAIATPSTSECRTHSQRYDWINVAPKIAQLYKEAMS
ncbi:glycosyltransferase family 4 protein [Acidithiobacillus ferrianus]|uniref:Glycosyltransferase n=2 Tax=Acidithiobacillus ferrianus TaxID=2678518 RepID=A0A845U2P3_9PROT|nr:glycosyltransferase family 4 protein [Acidithiobacillus ferrianus]NDU41892.1 glycosyltransferase [Acidithiobacillus ferrianus]